LLLFHSGDQFSQQNSRAGDRVDGSYLIFKPQNCKN
jgi:hypothetical protein